ncbi:HAMP domain-containing histidine kinase [Alteromonadaceae bacterium M269]|nr:HAMP domain-containing histidine kinase [Alteromonadaceae bacterium M269]
MKETTRKIDFATILASAVHDMKNSLCLLLQSIETLSDNIAQQNPEASKELASLHYEASRVNTGLMQLLSLYRSEQDHLPINVDEHYLEDVIEELVATNENYIENKKMELSIDLDEDLAWFLDVDLINLMLNDVLVNAMRYSKHRIAIRVFTEESYLFVQVQDDGPGYPSSMLKISKATMQDFDVNTGRTGLGLFFARLIAEAHSIEDRIGSIHLENGGELGGSVFTLKLP